MRRVTKILRITSGTEDFYTFKSAYSRLDEHGYSPVPVLGRAYSEVNPVTALKIALDEEFGLFC